MKRHSRRRFLQRTAQFGTMLATAPLTGACGKQIVEVPRVVQVEKEITRIVSQIVRETVIVETTPEVIEKTVEVEKIVTAEPAPPQKATITADVSNRGWSQFALLMSPAFEDLFPNVQIRWRTVSDWGSYPGRIAALWASGQLGDLLEAPFGPLLAAWHREELIQPLDEIDMEGVINTEGIIASALHACTFDGKLVAMPLVCDGGANLLLYNREVFDKAGIAPPTPEWTLEDMAEAGARAVTAGQQAVQRGAMPRYGYAVRYALPDALPMLRLFGTALIERDGEGTAIDRSLGVQCLDWAHGLMVREIAPRPQQVVGGTVEMLLSGQVAMLRHGFWPYYGLTNASAASDAENARTRVEAVIYPTHPAYGTRAGVSVGVGYCITRTSVVAAQAVQWCKYMASREMGVQMFLGGYCSPGCRTASWKDTRVLAIAPVCAQVADVADACDTVRIPHNLRLAECNAAWNRHTRRLWYDDLTPQGCASQIARDIERILALPPEKPPPD